MICRRGLSRCSETKFFSAYDSNGKIQLFVINGTGAGIQQLTTVSMYGAGPSDVAVIGDKLVFDGYDSNGNDQVWVTDGTVAGTFALTHETRPGLSVTGTVGLQLTGITAFGSVALFYGYQSAGVTDGTVAGTAFSVGSVNIGDDYTPFGSDLLAYGGRGLGVKYSISSKTSSGAQLTTSSMETAPVVVGSKAFFAQNDQFNQVQLWFTDGTVSGTQQLTDLRNPTAGGQSPTDVSPFGTLALFNSDGALWESDGTVAGTHLLSDAPGGPTPPTAAGGPMDITTVGTKAFFVAQDLNGNEQMWVTDGTDAGTQLLTNFLSWSADFVLNQSQITPLGTDALFAGPGGTLWITDGTVAGTKQLSVSVNVTDITVVGNDALFSASSDGTTYQLWRTDGTQAGTYSVTSAALPGSGASLAPFDITAVGDMLACYAIGTRIATPTGAVPIEYLRVGDAVMLARGGTAQVTWLGHRRVDWTRHPQPSDIWPVRVRRHAFGPQLPGRDLCLSPDHAVYLDGVLIPDPLPDQRNHYRAGASGRHHLLPPRTAGA